MLADDDSAELVGGFEERSGVRVRNKEKAEEDRERCERRVACERWHMGAL